MASASRTKFAEGHVLGIAPELTPAVSQNSGKRRNDQDMRGAQNLRGIANYLAKRFWLQSLAQPSAALIVM